MNNTKNNVDSTFPKTQKKHDLSEAISLADRVIVLSKRPGKVVRNLPISLTLPDDSLLAARNAPEFHHYFNILWKEISDEH